MHLTVLGLNYKTAPIEVREKFSVGSHSIRRGLKNLDDYDGLNEAVVLSTCNRSEIYSVTADDCKDSVRQFLNDLIGGGVDEVENFLYEYEGENCFQRVWILWLSAKDKFYRKSRQLMQWQSQLTRQAQF